MTNNFTIKIDTPSKVIITGILKLPSPLAYEEHFKPILTNLEKSSDPEFTVDITDMDFLNSSGITALARIIIKAKQFDKKLTFIANPETAWQKKSLLNLQKLWSGMEISYS